MIFLKPFSGEVRERGPDEDDAPATPEAAQEISRHQSLLSIRVRFSLE